jgi:hypothetical protein
MFCNGKSPISLAFLPVLQTYKLYYKSLGIQGTKDEHGKYVTIEKLLL